MPMCLAFSKVASIIGWSREQGEMARAAHPPHPGKQLGFMSLALCIFVLVEVVVQSRNPPTASKAALVLSQTLSPKEPSFGGFNLPARTGIHGRCRRQGSVGSGR